MASRFSIEAAFTALDKISAPVTRMGNRVGKVTRRIGRGVDRLNSKFKKMGGAARSAFGLAGMAGAMLLAQQAMGAVVTGGAEFEQMLVGAATRFPEQIERTSEAFRELDALARRTGATVEFTATEAAGALNFMARAGFDATQATKLLPSVVDLATASELDLARASDIATDALGAFGLGTEDATQLSKNFARVSDQMTVTTNRANVNMEQLFETVKEGAPAANAAGVSMENVLAFTAQLAGAGLKASSAGTALKNVFLQLAKADVQKKLKDMNVEVRNLATGEMNDLPDIIDDLQKALGSLPKITQAGILDALFGKRGVTAMSIAVQKGTVGFREFRKELIRSEGETQRLAAIFRATRKGQIDAMNSSIESLSLTFSAANTGGISQMIKGITEATRAFDAFVQQHPQIAKIAGLLVVAAVAGLALAAIFGLVVAGLGLIGGSTAALIGLALGVAAVFGAWFFSLQPIQTFFINLLATFQQLPSRLFDFFGSRAGAGVPAASDPNERLADSIEERRQTSTADLRIIAPPGTVELERKGNAPGIGLTLVETGAL